MIALWYSVILYPHFGWSESVSARQKHGRFPPALQNFQAVVFLNYYLVKNWDKTRSVLNAWPTGGFLNVYCLRVCAHFCYSFTFTQCDVKDASDNECLFGIWKHVTKRVAEPKETKSRLVQSLCWPGEGSSTFLCELTRALTWQLGLLTWGPWGVIGLG